MEKDKREIFQSLVGYIFKDPHLLKQLLTHTSYANEKKNSSNPDVNIKDNERLEFLGDSVIEMIISHYLVDKYPDWREGELSKIRGYVVSKPVLANIAVSLNLGEYLFLGNGEDQSGGRKKESILADSFEALIGGMFLDGGLEPTKVFLLECLRKKIDSAVIEKSFKDSKSAFQEYAQATFSCVPKYKVIRETGPEHQKSFEVSVEINKKIIGSGEGRTRKEAEQMAAKDAIERRLEDCESP